MKQEEITIFGLNKVMRQLPDPNEYIRSHPYGVIKIFFLDECFMMPDIGEQRINISPLHIEFKIRVVGQKGIPDYRMGYYDPNYKYEWVLVTDLIITTQSFL